MGLRSLLNSNLYIVHKAEFTTSPLDTESAVLPLELTLCAVYLKRNAYHLARALNILCRAVDLQVIPEGKKNLTLTDPRHKGGNKAATKNY